MSVTYIHNQNQGVGDSLMKFAQYINEMNQSAQQEKLLNARLQHQALLNEQQKMVNEEQRVRLDEYTSDSARMNRELMSGYDTQYAKARLDQLQAGNAQSEQLFPTHKRSGEIALEQQQQNLADSRRKSNEDPIMFTLQQRAFSLNNDLKENEKQIAEFHKSRLPIESMQKDEQFKMIKDAHEQDLIGKGVNNIVAKLRATMEGPRLFQEFQTREQELKNLRTQNDALIKQMDESKKNNATERLQRLVNIASSVNDPSFLDAPEIKKMIPEIGIISEFYRKEGNRQSPMGRNVSPKDLIGYAIINAATSNDAAPEVKQAAMELLPAYLGVDPKNILTKDPVTGKMFLQSNTAQYVENAMKVLGSRQGQDRINNLTPKAGEQRSDMGPRSDGARLTSAPVSPYDEFYRPDSAATSPEVMAGTYQPGAKQATTKPIDETSVGNVITGQAGQQEVLIKTNAEGLIKNTQAQENKSTGPLSGIKETFAKVEQTVSQNPNVVDRTYDPMKNETIANQIIMSGTYNDIIFANADGTVKAVDLKKDRKDKESIKNFEKTTRAGLFPTLGADPGMPVFGAGPKITSTENVVKPEFQKAFDNAYTPDRQATVAQEARFRSALTMMSQAYSQSGADGLEQTYRAIFDIYPGSGIDAFSPQAVQTLRAIRNQFGRQKVKYAQPAAAKSSSL